MDVYRPKTVTIENKGPAIVVMHGGNNAKENVSNFCIELARRGYVILNVDMNGHGESEKLPDSEWLTAGRGLYDGVKYAAELPYVDVNRIGVLGYSRGARAISETIPLDNAAQKQLISVAYMVHSDAIYKIDGKYADAYGSRDVGIDADRYDEFFFSEKAETSGVSYSAEANRFATSSTTPFNYIINPSAQSFLYFGTDPSTVSEKRIDATVYTKDFDGEIGSRIIDVTNETHMRPWFSTTVVNNFVRFFDRTLPTDTSIPLKSCIFPISFFFSLLGVIGCLMVMIAVAFLLIDKIKFFKDVKISEPEFRHVTDKQGKIWFWLLQIVCFALGVFVLWLMNKLQLSIFKDTIFRSSIPLFHGIMCLLCGAYTAIALVVWYLCYGKKHGVNLVDCGFALSWKKIGKSFLVALISVFTLYLITFLANYLFKTNYLFIYWGFMSFDADRLLNMLIILPFFMVYYCIMSFSINCFNFNDVTGKLKWVNTLILSLFAALPPLFVIEYVYGIYRATNWNPNFGGMASAPTWIIALPMIIFVLMIIGRILYKKTNNPYLSGSLTAVLASVVAWTVAEIRIPEADSVFVPNLKITLILVIGFGLAIASFVILRKQIKKQKEEIKE